jgi:hypothetical protein
LEKCENRRFYKEGKLNFWHPVLKILGNISHVVACRSSFKNTRNWVYTPFWTLNYSQFIENQNWACLVLSKACKRHSLALVSEFWKIKNFHFLQVAQIANDQNLVSRSLNGIRIIIRESCIDNSWCSGDTFNNPIYNNYNYIVNLSRFLVPMNFKWDLILWHSSWIIKSMIKESWMSFDN